MFLNRALLPAAVAGTLAFVSTARVPAASAELWQAWTKSEGRRTVAERPQSEPSKKPCCFANPGYAGTCKVQPAEDETCFVPQIEGLRGPVLEKIPVGVDGEAKIVLGDGTPDGLAV